MFFPYLIIASIWYAVRYLLIERSIIRFLYELSTVSFWAEHHGAWYIAVLVPIYFLFPFYYDWIEKGNHIRKVYSSIVSFIIASFVLSIVNENTYNHLANVLCSCIAFLLGVLFAYEGNLKKHTIVSVGVTGLLLVCKVSPFVKSLGVITYFLILMIGVLAVLIVSILLKQFQVKPINAVLSFLGGFSLELYLTNIYLGEAVNVFSIGETLKNMGIPSATLIVYSGVVLVGILLSYCFSRLFKVIIK